MRRTDIDADAVPVIVPRNDKPLVSTSPARVQRLREHLATVLIGMGDDETTSAVRPGPEGFEARVAHAACSLCAGWCCKNGADDAFLDERTLARVVRSAPEMNTDSVLRLYVERVPEIGYRDSCIFHGRRGCTLDRSLRSDVCNAYFCGGLQGYLRSGDTAAPAVIIAGEGKGMRTSAILRPGGEPARPSGR